MSEKNDETVDEEELENPRPDGATITIEVPVSERHADIIDELEENGLPVAQQLEQNPEVLLTVENEIYSMYQQGRYSRQ